MKPIQFNEHFDFEVFFESSPDFICIAGPDGYFKRANPVVTETLGYSQEELLSRPISTFVRSDDQSITPEVLDGESQCIKKNGEIVWIRWTSTLLESQQLILAIGKNTSFKNQRKEQASLYKAADQAWLSKFETTIRKYSRKMDLNLNVICDELAIGERQLFRRTRTIVGVTPNQYVRKIRLQIAMEAIQTGKYRTISEISNAAGFQTPSYFKKLFESTYNVELEHLL